MSLPQLSAVECERCPPVVGLFNMKSKAARVFGLGQGDIQRLSCNCPHGALQFGTYKPYEVMISIKAPFGSSFVEKSKLPNVASAVYASKGVGRLMARVVLGLRSSQCGGCACATTTKN